MSLVEEIKCDVGLVKRDNLKNEIQNKNQEIIPLTALMKDRGMIREDKNRLNEIFKKPLALLIKLKTREINEVDEALKVVTF